MRRHSVLYAAAISASTLSEHMSAARITQRRIVLNREEQNWRKKACIMSALSGIRFLFPDFRSDFGVIN